MQQNGLDYHPVAPFLELAKSGPAHGHDNLWADTAQLSDYENLKKTNKIWDIIKW